MVSNKKLRTFDGATSIVTGGASGIGRALTKELAKQGCDVVIADRQIELAKEVTSEIHVSRGKVTATKIDVTDFLAMEKLVQETVERTGRLDYIFNNAGIGMVGYVNECNINDWNQIIDVNLRGVVNGVQAAYRIMRDQGFGHIVNTASMAGLIPSPRQVAYATTKHAVVGLSKSLRAEAAQEGVLVSVLCPGLVRTAILEGGGKYGRHMMSPEQERRMFEMIEKQKPMSPDIFAKKALNLVAINKAIIILPSWNKLLWWADRLCPSLGLFLARKNPFQDT